MSKRIIFTILYVAVLIFLFFGGLKLVDVWFLDDPNARQGSIGDPSMTQRVDPARPDITVNTLDLYPWTGGHTQANFSLNNGRFRSGDHGFFIDFDLDQPPAKPKREFRIVLIGGSAAAGWGASGNENMLYKVLERQFSDKKPCGAEITLSVINLAMGGSVTHQNFTALNRWGHQLEPDLILSFSGINDLAYMYGGVDGWFGFSTVQAYVQVSRFEASPPFLKAVARFYPGLVRNTAIGMAVRTFHFRDYEKFAWGDYIARYPAEPTDARQGVEKIAIPRYVHSMQSIKRDFLGIPMFIVYQPFMATSANPGSLAEFPISHDEYRRHYEKFISGSQQSLDGYMDHEWSFFNAHEYYARKMASRHLPEDGVHLNDAKQQELGAAIGKHLFPVVCRIADSKG